MVDKLLESDISTVERLADMTPEQLEEIPGIGPKMVEKIQVAVNSYYLQFEQPQPPAEEVVPPDEPVSNGAAAGDAAPVAPAFMPGLPVEGEDVDESEPGIDEEDFDNMDLSASDETDESDEVESDFDEGEEAATAAAAVATEPANGDATLDVRKKTTIEDDEMKS
jgi:N utilization substance protein A